MRVTALMDLISCSFFAHRELIQNSNAAKHQKISSTDHTQLVELLLAKDMEMKNVLKLAERQAQIQQKMIALEAKVDMRVSVQSSHLVLTFR